METTAPQQSMFTAAQIAEKLGKSVRVVRRWLGGVKSDGSIVVRGMLAATWRVESLPDFIQQLLKSSAQRRGFVGVAELLSGEIKARPSLIPWNEICPEQQSEAIKLQRALLPALEHWKEITTSPSAHDYAWRNDATLLSIGLSVYEKEFGAKVSAERWQYLFNRVLERDRGAAQFHNLELFVSGNARREPSAPSEAEKREFPALHDLIFNKCSNPQNPSSAERARLWQCVYQHLRPLSGRELKHTRLGLLKYLWSVAPWLAASKNALRVALDRFTARGTECNGAIEAFYDWREGRRGISTGQPYDKDQVALLKITAVNFTGGNQADAARRLDEAGLITDPRIKRSLDTATSKSHLPASLRAEMKDLSTWQAIQLGPRCADKLRPTMKLTYEGIHSMCCLVPDDKTPDIYIAVPDGQGWWDVMRPQLIPIADFRSTMIVGRACVPAPQFTALDVWGPFIKIFNKFGFPRFIMREGGKIFRGSNLVNSLSDIGTGRRRNENGRSRVNNPFSVTEIEFALERSKIKLCDDPEQVANQLGEAGIQFREAYRANAKPVEGVIRLLDREIRILRAGYCGTDERLNCPEATKRAVELVRNRKAEPAYPVTDPKTQVEMLVWDQWTFAVDQAIDRYNNTKQEGDRLRNPLTGEPMSPAEAFEIFQNTDNPPAPLTPECAAFLSPMKIEVEVKKPNIRRRQFPCGFVQIMGNTYCDEQTGARIGKKLLAFYNPETPEVCTFSDRNFRNYFTVERLESVNALFPNEQTRISLSQAHRAVSGVKADYQAAATKFLPIVGKALVSPLIKKLNQQIEKGTAAVQEKQRRKTNRADTISRKVRGTGLHSALVENSERSLSALELIQKSKEERAREIAQEKSK